MINDHDLDEPDPELTDGLVRLRRWALGDLPCVEAAGDEGRIPESTTVPASFTVAAGQEWIARQHRRTTSGQGWSLAITEVGTDRAVGCIVLLLRPQPGVGGIGFWLIPAGRGQGYASRAVELMASWALGPAGLARVEAWVEPGNLASAAVLGRCGFEFEGRLRSLLSFGSRRADALVFSRIAHVQGCRDPCDACGSRSATANSDRAHETRNE